ncbi:hypothetical protein AGMMS50268_03890 [Spirochaetia bacterium]|nr:hypothetical protein AGMMS50268_03890 [Spirochaetia bacterium]
MKIKLPVHAILKGGYIVLKEVNKSGKELIERLFTKKVEWEERNKREFYLQIELDLRYQHRTFKQNSSVWVLVTAIFESMEDRLPDEEEKYSLYLDLLELYADKIPNRFGGLRTVHISESNSIEGARFIDGLLHHLATVCDLSMDSQASVVDVMWEWEEWRGNMKIDPMDYSDLACTQLLTEAEWREKHPVSEASGKGGRIELAHIVTRGADGKDIEMPWNWIALLHEEHIGMQHQKGWDEFLQIYPHLRGRVERARQMAGKLELKALPKKPQDLALEALENE